MAPHAIPSQVIWSYSVGGLVLAVWLAGTALRKEWWTARGLDRLLLLGLPCYAAPLAAFGTEHFTLPEIIASLVPAWIPWPRFWTYLIGACFIAAAFALVTRIRTRLAASLLALTFFCFVVVMDVPAWLQDPRDRFSLTLALRELAFCGGAVALVAALTGEGHERRRDLLATIARYFVGVPVLVFGVQQLMHGDHVPAVPLKRLTPEYVYGHAIWTYLAGVVFLLAGAFLVAGKRTRAAATWLGVAVLWVVLVVYVPIAVVQRASLEGLNYFADTLMFCGVILLLAGAMPRDAPRHAPSTSAVQPQG